MCKTKQIQRLISGLLCICLAVCCLMVPGSRTSAATVVYGDVNGDGQVDSIDNALIKQFVLQKISTFPSVDGKTAADVNLDGTVDAIDYATVSQFLLGKIASLPVGSQPTAKKFVGNIIASSVPSNWSNYWNQVTPENATKWGSVEGSRDVMNWGNADLIYNYAKSKNIPFKYHTLIWGSQEPGWISGLSAADQKAEVIEWIQAAAKKYPDAQMVDVVNEALHAPPSYRNALGGNGTTGWDWVIWSFEQARQYFPNSKLLINDYGIISDPNAAANYVKIINLLKDRKLVDGIGIQCHQFNMDTVTTTTMKSVLNTLSATGLPIYVSELDITGDDNTQQQRYSEKFPVLYENPNVKGITLWGYIEGQTWKSGTHLITASGVERPALKWLKQYLATH